MRNPLKKVFFIDDQTDIHTLAKLAFKKVVGVEVVFFTSGSDAVAQIQSQNPDLIISDVQMPDFNGHDVLRAIGSLPAPARPVVFMLTGETNPDEVDLLKKEGAALVMNKGAGFMGAIAKLQATWGSIN